jgi:CheY-like chemotaxis protein
MAKTLLLADDSVTIQKVVGISFANEDVTLLTVDNGDDAVSREVCEAIKSDPELRDTPVLLLTGTFEAFDEERATRVGADGYITKPFEAQALVDQVNARLARPTAAAPAPEPEPASAPLTAPERGRRVLRFLRRGEHGASHRLRTRVQRGDDARQRRFWSRRRGDGR